MNTQGAASSLKPIVLKELIAEKNQKLANRIPGFVYKLMNRLLHIPEVNEITSKYGNLSGIPFVEALFRHFNISFVFEGVENLPSEGRYIFAANHPLGGFDGLILINGVTKYLGKSLFLVRDELTKIPPLKPLFIPINKFGNQQASVLQIAEAYQSDAQILVFPAGLASRKINGVIADLEWQKHFIQKSIEYQRDIIPVHISGKNTNHFYWLANFRKKLGLKINLEMFLLPDELFRQKNRTFTITFKKPIPWQTFDKSKSLKSWAAEVRSLIYKKEK
jgi:putative hemolysin